MTKYGVFLRWLASLLYEISFSVILYLQVKGEKLYEQSQKPPIDHCRKTNKDRWQNLLPIQDINSEK